MPDQKDDRVKLARRRLVQAACASVAGAVLFIILFWVFSGTLEDIETVFAGGAFLLILGGIAWLAQRGRERLAAWFLAGLLTLLITVDIQYYGVGTPSAAGFVLPVVLAACALGLWAGLGVSLVGCAVIWLVAWGSTSGGWVSPPAPIDHLTFNAPALTVILVATALIVGLWSRSLEK